MLVGPVKLAFWTLVLGRFMKNRGQSPGDRVVFLEYAVGGSSNAYACIR